MGGFAAVSPNGEILLSSLLNVDLNTGNDQSVGLPSGLKLISRIVVVDATGTTATVEGGLYTGAAMTGTTVVAAGQVYSALTATKSLDLTIANDYLTGTGLFVALSVLEGAASTCDIYVFGQILDNL